MADHPAPSPVDDSIEGDETTTYPPPPASDPPLRLRAPYDRLDGDVILRCSDNVGFRVHRLILVLASPVFADMFSLPQPATAESESAVSPPTIDLTEDSKTILPLLDACYPFGDPTLDDLDTIDRVLDAAAKYDVAKATQFSQRRLHAFVSWEPLRAFAIACRMHFEDLAKAAADRVHALSIFENGLVYVKELDRVSAGCYHRLLQHYRRRGKWRRIRFCPPDRVLCDPRTKRKGTKKKNKGPPLDCQDSHPQTRNAPHPFHTESQTHAEITTSDHVRFGVSQEFILSAAPGIARRLVELSPADHGVADGANTSLLQDASREPEEQIDRASVHSCARFSATIEEDSELFLPLLQLCHPDAAPVLPWEDLTFIRRMIDAARKYNMKKAIWFLQAEWQRSISLDPFRAYVLASTWGGQRKHEHLSLS